MDAGGKGLEDRRSELGFEGDLRWKGRDASYRASEICGTLTWACARRTHSSPGYHITGFQPSEVISGLRPRECGVPGRGGGAGGRGLAVV
ncbi:hypothetical protein SBV1_1970006 [Verrucomicrobia bacterium]|nr:hypothetical protein SBV1_1970006 [Verrucomicrobiota bacterium]